MSKQKSSRKVSNFACIARIILGPCTDTLRDVLKYQMSLSELNDNFFKFLRKTKIKRENFRILETISVFVFASDNYSEFEIPLLYFLLRWICDIPLQGHEWGRRPSEKDKSLSANIERVYLIQAKYSSFSKRSLDDSTFEEAWENVLSIIKELEVCIGSGTVYQDVMKKIKNSSLDPDVERVFIDKLTGMFVDHRHIRCGTCGYPTGFRKIVDKVFVNRSIEYVIPKIGHQLGHPEMEDIPQRRLEHITSESLKELFDSFKVKFQAADPGNESFARTILNDDTLELETAIQSLSREIVLTNLMNANPLNVLVPTTPQVDACVFEVDVVYEGDGDGNGDQFCVIRKDISPNMVFDISEDKRIKVVLIRSQFLPVVPSKLLVYKSFKHEINEKELFLQHEYEDFDDVAKLIAYRLLSSFCSSLESMIYIFTTDLQKIMSDKFDKLLTAEEIKEICSDSFKKMAYKPFVQRTTSFRNWRCEFAEFITSKLSKEELDGEDAWKEIQSACKKTVDDLKFILKELEKFQSNELQVDQKKQIEEWHKREVTGIESFLRDNPSIIKYIAGHRGKGPRDVVKVFVYNDDEATKECFKTFYKRLDNTDFEFVKVNRTEEQMEQNEEKENLEGNDLAFEISDNIQLTQIIQKQKDIIHARHSSLIGIRIGNISQVDDLEQEQLGIILYCLDKTLIPFGEKPLPNSIKGWPCDVREDFFLFGTCPNSCRRINPNLTELGCSIGIKSDPSAGSAGFFYESKTQENPFGSGFLTASHVAIKQRKLLYSSGKRLSQHELRHKTHIIVHPSFIDDNTDNEAVGRVVEAFYGNYGDPSIGLDVAAVKNYTNRPEEMETMPILTKDDLVPGKLIKVKKTGRTTKTTFGYLKGVSTSIYDPADTLFGLPLSFDLPYHVVNMLPNVPFFQPGDSGSGVLVVGEEVDVPLGIAVAFSQNERLTYVCKIDKILNDLDINIVKYKKDKNKTLSNTGESLERKHPEAKDQSPTT